MLFSKKYIKNETQKTCIDFLRERYDRTEENVSYKDVKLIG